MLTKYRMINREILRLPSKIYTNRHFTSKTKNELDIEFLTKNEVRLSSHKPKQKQREPFAKGLYIGKYDIEMCAFPEPQTHERHRNFFEWLKPIEEYVNSSIDMREIDKSAKIPDHVLEQMKDFGVLRAAVPDEYKGLGLNNSEYSKLVETFSKVPVLGTYLVRKAITIHFIELFGSDKLKEAYLPKIASGEFIPSSCISENIQGSNNTSIFCRATLSECGKFWILNGTKTYVVDGKNSNLFVVIAECSDLDKSFKPESNLTGFVVEKDFGGISISEPVDTIGLRGLDMCHVTFKDTVVPVENMIGEVGSAAESFTSIYSDGKHNIGSQSIGIMKKFLQLLVEALKKDKDFNTVKFQRESIQEVVGKICGTIYGMESALYLATGMMDTFADQDCIMEQCMVETFCADECINSIVQGIQVLGIEAHLKDNLFQQLYRDAMCLTSFDGSLLTTKSFISLLGYQFAGKCIGEDVKYKRNPVDYPYQIIKFWCTFGMKKKLHLADNLHPTLSTCAGMLEEGIYRLKKAIATTAAQDGIHLVNKDSSLKRLTDASTHLYVMGAVLARSSRSYCLGIRDAENELKIAQIYAFMLYEKFTILSNQIEAGEWVNGDFMLREIANGAFEIGSYYVENPLARNF